ncbi:hypothetical protein ACHAXS_008370 [Conticribra weissflogii]
MEKVFLIIALITGRQRITNNISNALHRFSTTSVPSFEESRSQVMIEAGFFHKSYSFYTSFFSFFPRHIHFDLNLIVHKFDNRSKIFLVDGTDVLIIDRDKLLSPRKELLFNKHQSIGTGTLSPLQLPADFHFGTICSIPRNLLTLSESSSCLLQYI